MLELEITESAVMDDAEYALRVLHSLRDDGIPLYIDDFGTGYSSLSYLQKLPVEYIKIDQSFVRDMGRNTDSALIVRSTIDLVHDLAARPWPKAWKPARTGSNSPPLAAIWRRAITLPGPCPPTSFRAAAQFIPGLRPFQSGL